MTVEPLSPPGFKCALVHALGNLHHFFQTLIDLFEYVVDFIFVFVIFFSGFLSAAFLVLFLFFFLF